MFAILVHRILDISSLGDKFEPRWYLHTAFKGLYKAWRVARYSHDRAKSLLFCSNIFQSQVRAKCHRVYAHILNHQETYRDGHAVSAQSTFRSPPHGYQRSNTETELKP